MADDLPERDHGELGESAGATLMRALDNAQRVEESGGTITGVVVITAIEHPPDEEHEHGGGTISLDHTPGQPTHATVGLLITILDSLRYGD